MPALLIHAAPAASRWTPCSVLVADVPVRVVRPGSADGWSDVSCPECRACAALHFNTAEAGFVA